MHWANSLSSGRSGPGWWCVSARRSPSSAWRLCSRPDNQVDAQIDKADIACPTTAELSPSVANRQCPRLPSQVSGELVQADRSLQGERHLVIVNIAQELGSSHSIARIHDLKRGSMLITNGSCHRPQGGQILLSLVGVEVRAGR